MCGIVGSVNKPFGREILDLIHHRGPDDRGLVKLNFNSNMGQKDTINFGHTRLSIQDLSMAGHQPMYDSQRKFLIVFNGEIYNHLKLRKNLAEIPFNGHSDTETIVNYIAKFGIQSIKEFNGIFALAILDIQNQKMYLARDRFGVKPLYYFFDKNSFIFSSEVKPILALIKDFEIDMYSLSVYLTLRYNPSPKTMFQNIKKVIPGEILEYDILNKNLKSLFNINKDLVRNIKVDNTKSESYWIDALTEKIEEAVSRQMLSDVEVGSFLSGGIDSALITAIASKYSKTKIKTFCVGFEGSNKKNDETEEARRSAEILNTEHYETIVNPKAYFKFIKNSIYILEEPNGTAPTLAQYEVSKLASKYVKVALAGQGADEIFMGYQRYRAELKRKKYALIIKFLKWFEFFLKNLKSDKLKRALYSLGENNDFRRFVKMYTVFREDEKSRLMKKFTKPNYNELSLTYFYDLISSNIDSTSKMSILDTYTWLSDELLIYGDKMTMATSLEMRVPFLDNELVQLVQRIPVKYKINNGTHKYILKQVAKKYLPQEIIDRPKKGFSLPILKWLQEDLNDNLRELLVEKDACIHKYINKKEIDILIKNYKEKKENDHRKLFLLWQLEIFLKIFREFNYKVFYEKI